MEAAWIAAVILVPLFFDIYSSRIFEPDKITLLRTLALAILGAWMLKLIEEAGIHWQRIERGKTWLDTFRQVPFLLPVTGLVVVYLLSTIFSVTPSVSLWGSYQRLQGTYSTFSYVVVFAAMAVNLRRRAQVQRLISAVVLTSLPISLYGLLQRFGLDPIPWGGDVTARIAGNMGNSIFIAAYLIMAFPLTLMRIVESFEALLDAPAPGRESGSQSWQLPNFLRATIYVFVAALQVIALYFTNSRGPWLGWGASLVFLWLGLSLIWRKRWLTIAGVAIALVAAVFLVLLNIPNGPLESLRTRPEFGRLGQLLDSESRTGKVRTLIWQGASELVLPHDPILFPDGKPDALNFLRPLIGYGPESMYVAYNPFYPPELTLVEKRNASPDRSHNETWDSLVITGLLGLIVYLVLFGSVLYFGLKWLGLVQDARQRNLYLGLYIGGGLLSSIIFLIWQGLPFLGVALPFGMIMGIIIYMILVSLFGHFVAINTPYEKLRAYILLALLAAVVAHFIEINFGIAIAATRTYFWVYSGMLLLVGYVLPRYSQFGESANPSHQRQERHAEQLDETSPMDGSGDLSVDEKDKEPVAAAKTASKNPSSRSAASGRKSASSATSASAARKKRRAGLESGALPLARLFPETWQRQAVVLGLILGIILMTLGYLYITNASRDPNAFAIIWNSLTRLKQTEAGSGSSGLVTLVLTTWLVGALLVVSEALASRDVDLPAAASAAPLLTWMKMLGITLGVSFVIMLTFWLLHASGLIALTRSTATSIEMVLDQVKTSEGILTTYYFFLFLVLSVMAFLLLPEWPGRSTRLSEVSVIAAVGLPVVVIVLAMLTNLRIIQADIAFKTADLFARPESWPVSIAIYNHARDLAPSEDYYYLFLGRAYLEYAKTLENPAQQDQVIQQAAQDLVKAQEINPLNTDHTANLARLYNLWAASSTDMAKRSERAAIAEKYFAGAITLSPNSARLLDEYALLYLNVLNQPQEALDKLTRALEIDPYYDWTYALLGDYYSRFVANDPQTSSSDRQAALEKAAESYQKALDLSQDNSLRFNYYLALAAAQTQLGQIEQALENYLQALQISPNPANNWRIQEVMARLYLQIGDRVNALQYAQAALAGAPDDQKQSIQALILELGSQP